MTGNNNFNSINILNKLKMYKNQYNLNKALFFKISGAKKTSIY
jgi:hypothetical protein